MPSTLYIWDANSFQFHKGAIRTNFSGSLPQITDYFNSIKVRLEPKMKKLPESLIPHFNSIKVRLERMMICGTIGAGYDISIP